jgi:hypothetical protein
MTITVANQSPELVSNENSDVVTPSSSRKQTVIVFDWDDTLMSSSWVDREKLIQINSFSSLPIALQKTFSILEEHVAKCLTEATKLGSVIIITNAEAGWVEYSSKRFMPRLVPLLCNTRVVSARTTYERFYPSAPLCWKAAAFAHEANLAFSSNDGDDEGESKNSTLGRQIISFGDSNEERTAVKIAAGQLNAISKSIKFVDLPSPEQLCKQIETVTGWFQWVHEHETELDLMLKASLNQDELITTNSSVSMLSDCNEFNADHPFRPPEMATLDPDPVTH